MSILEAVLVVYVVGFVVSIVTMLCCCIFYEYRDVFSWAQFGAAVIWPFILGIKIYRGIREAISEVL